MSDALQILKVFNWIIRIAWSEKGGVLQSEFLIPLKTKWTRIILFILSQPPISLSLPCIFFSVHMHVSVLTFMYMNVDVWMTAYMWKWEDNLGCQTSPSTLLDNWSLNVLCCVLQASQPMSYGFSHLLLISLGKQVYCNHSCYATRFFVDSGDSNSGPHKWFLFTEPSPQPEFKSLVSLVS